MPTPDFRLQIEDSFVIKGRGTAVIGRLISGDTASGEPVCVQTDDGKSRRVDDVVVDLDFKGESDQRALMLQGVNRDQVPRGAMLLACE